jgi:hypothetical protein
MNNRKHYASNRRANMRKTPKPCSCHMCCNLRSINGPTRAERAAFITLNEELDDFAVSRDFHLSLPQPMMAIICANIVMEVASIGRHATCGEYHMVITVLDLGHYDDDEYRCNYARENTIWQTTMPVALIDEHVEFHLTQAQKDVMDMALAVFRLHAPRKDFYYGQEMHHLSPASKYRAADYVSIYECTPALKAMNDDYERRVYGGDWPWDDENP